ncbi:MAG TPA: FeoB-associated Cys-rich membrane protein [bacterium]|nr:FeoB-associated Cys-rich membrane protein [bacterium]
MQTAIVLTIIVFSVGWFGYRLYRTATAKEGECAGCCGCGCGKDPLADYRREKDRTAE